MRLPATCFQCTNLAHAAGKSVESLSHTFLDLADDGAYVGRCEHGHQVAFALQNLRHEILFESGAVSMLMGFHREAVADMVGAQERFYEFAIRVLLLHSGVDASKVDLYWKELASASERQLGSFLGLYLAAFKEPFATQKMKNAQMVEFRNACVHKGKFPTRAETEKYAEAVYETIRATRTRLIAFAPDTAKALALKHALSSARVLHVKAPPEKAADGMFHMGGTAYFAMMLSDLAPSGDLADFSTALAGAASRLVVWGLALPNAHGRFAVAGGEPVEPADAQGLDEGATE